VERMLYFSAMPVAPRRHAPSMEGGEREGIRVLRRPNPGQGSGAQLHEKSRPTWRRPEAIVTNRLSYYGAAMNELPKTLGALLVPLGLKTP